MVGSTTGAVVGPSGSLAAGAALAAAAIFSGLLPSMAVLALGVAAQAAVARCVIMSRHVHAPCARRPEI